MKYFVVAADGQRYGPADVPTLNQWASEGRINEQTMLADEAGGPPTAASMVPGLVFAGAPGAPAAPATGPVSPVASPYEAQQASAFVNYPRGGQAVQDVPTNFNWGAFFFNWIWGLNHKAYITLIVLVTGCVPIVGGLVNLGLAIWFGTKGNQWAWESGRFSSVEDMMECQRIWAKWAFWWFIAIVVIAVVYVVVVAMAVTKGATTGIKATP